MLVSTGRRPGQNKKDTTNMNANTGKIEINRDWYDAAKKATDQYINGMDFYLSDPRAAMIDELPQVENMILLGKAVLV